MPAMSQSTVMDDTALPANTLNRLKRLGHADVVVGIPSHRNGRTIGEVVEAVSQGISIYLADQRVVLLNADGGSSDNTTRFVQEATLPANAVGLVTDYSGTMGKGTAIRAILEAAHRLGAKACAVVEARCPGIAPEWIPNLVTPVLSGYDMVLASYQRSPYAAALTDNLCYPLSRLLFNADLREPLAAEFCISGELAGELAMRDVWETDVARFGINIWLTMQALVEERRIAQVDLGYRGEAHCDPGVLSDPRFTHMAGTLFRYLTTHRAIWQQDLPLRPIPFVGAKKQITLPECEDYTDLLLKGFAEGRETLDHHWQQVLSADTLRAILDLFDQAADAFDFPVDLWARSVIEFAVVYNRGEGDPDRVVDALLPLFHARTASYLRETRGLGPHAREARVAEIVSAFRSLKPVLADLWADYRPWLDPSGYWPTG